MADGNRDPNILLYGAGIMKKIIDNHPNPPLIVHKNLGVAYQFLGRIDARYNTPMYEAWKTYVRKNPPGDKDVPNIKRILASYEAQRANIMRARQQQRRTGPTVPNRGVSSQPKSTK